MGQKRHIKYSIAFTVPNTVCVCVCVCVLVTQSYDHMDCSSPGSSVHGILQARILEWIAIPISRGFSQPRDRTKVFSILKILYHPIHQGSPTQFAAAKSLQSCPTLSDPIDGSPPGSPVPGILQARTLEWVAISFSNA